MATELDLMNADLMAIPGWAVVNAVRYALNHPVEESNTIAMCDWLVGHWNLLPDHVREIVRDDVEEISPWAWYRSEVTRDEWDRVRQLWSSDNVKT